MISKKELKYIKSLQLKKFRGENNEFLVEGTRLIIDGLKTNVINYIYYCPQTCSNNNFSLIKPFLLRDKIPFTEIDQKEFNLISDTINSQGIIGIAIIKKPKIKHCINLKLNWIYLDKIKDPGNVGTILRTAEWFGIKNIAFSPESVDPYNSKVVRSGMGAHFNLNIFTNLPLNIIKDYQIKIFLSDTSGETLLNTDLLKKWCLVLGNEAEGISEMNQLFADKIIKIAGSGKTESLNVAVSSGILMYQLTKNLNK